MLANTLVNAAGSAILVVVVIPIVWVLFGGGEFLKRLTIFQHGWGLALVAVSFAIAGINSQPDYPHLTVVALAGVGLILSAIATNQYKR